MTLIAEILEHNRSFVARREYEALRTDRFPNKKLVVVTCMDTRLSELLPRAMDMGQGDAKIIKTAGAVISHPFGGIMRSVLVAVYELDAREVVVVGHHDCGMAGLDCGRILEKAERRGVSPQTLETLRHAGVDLKRWLTGFERVEDGVRESVEMVRNHPLMPRDLPVHGLLISPETGKLDVLVDGYGR